jgi:glycosyltransferase involved in cell wall biosynthesis
MRILFLSDNFPPEVNAPASRTYEHCREWVRAGHQVTVITGFPNFPQGRLYAGYRHRPWMRETIDGIDVVRVWTFIAKNRGVVRRTIDFLSFMTTSAVAGSLIAQPDVVIATSPQFFTTCAGAFVASVQGRPFVFELRDLWPEEIRELGVIRNTHVLGMLERVELSLYERAQLVVAVTEGFKTRLVERGVDPRKITVVRNGVDLTRFQPRMRDGELLRELDLENRFLLGYLGTHGQCQGLSHVLDAAALCASDPRLQHCFFLFVGDGAEKASLQQSARERGLRNVLFLDAVPKNEVVRYWSILDVALIPVREGALFRRVIPSKLFECMGMGVPVILGVEGESADIVETEGVGICVPPGDAAAMFNAIVKLVSNPEFLLRMRTNSTSAAIRYSRDSCASSMLNAVTSVVHATRIPSEHGTNCA